MSTGNPTDCASGHPVLTLASLPRSSAMISPAEVARVLGKDRQTIYRWLESGKLKGRKVNAKQWLIAWDWVLEFAQPNNQRRRGACS